MTAPIFKYSFATAAVIVAVVAGGWYFLDAPAVTPESTPASVGVPGTIEGTTAYPSEFNPAQRVCAQSTTDSGYERCTDVPEQEGPDAPKFSIKVTPGSYHVYAYLRNPADLGLTESHRAYWTEFVRCGTISGCGSHAPLLVVVVSGMTVVDIRPQDWYQ